MARSSIQVLCLVLCWCLFGTGVCIGQDRDCLVQKAESLVGIRELTGNNDHPLIDEMLDAVNVPRNLPYCAASNAWIYTQCGFTDHPNSAWSPDWGRDKDAVYFYGQGYKIARIKARPGDVFTKYYASKKRIAHTGVYIYCTVNRVYLIEGNTNDDGSRDGNGWYRKVRHWNEVYRITNYIDK